MKLLLLLMLQAAAEAPDPLADCKPADVSAAVRCVHDYGKPSLNESIKTSSRGDMALAHMGFGMWVRNNWDLWRGGPLQSFFRAKGVSHPDEMSSYILTALWLDGRGCKADWNDLEAVRAMDERVKADPKVCEAAR